MVRRPPPRSGRVRWAALTGAGFGLLTAAVLADVGVPGIDRALVRAWRPDDAWGPPQRAAETVVVALQPLRCLAALAAASVLVALWRRSLRPMLYAGGTVTVALLTTYAVKLATSRPDPHGVSWHGGSYPSGHTVTVMTCVGVLTLLLWPERVPAWAWVPTAATGAVVGLALVVQASHWLSDVVGAGLLAALLLAGAAAVPLRRTSRRGAERAGGALPEAPLPLVPVGGSRRLWGI